MFLNDPTKRDSKAPTRGVKIDDAFSLFRVSENVNQLDPLHHPVEDAERAELIEYGMAENPELGETETVLPDDGEIGNEPSYQLGYDQASRVPDLKEDLDRDETRMGETLPQKTHLDHTSDMSPSLDSQISLATASISRIAPQVGITKKADCNPPRELAMTKRRDAEVGCTSSGNKNSVHSGEVRVDSQLRQSNQESGGKLNQDHQTDMSEIRPHIKTASEPPNRHPRKPIGSIRRSFRNAFILMLAAILGMVGYFAGRKDAGIFDDSLMFPVSESHELFSEVSRQNPSAKANGLLRPTKSQSAELSNAFNAEVTVEPITIQLIRDPTQSEIRQITDEEQRHWSDFFRILNHKNFAITAEKDLVTLDDLRLGKTRPQEAAISNTSSADNVWEKKAMVKRQLERAGRRDMNGGVSPTVEVVAQQGAAISTLPLESELDGSLIGQVAPFQNSNIERRLNLVETRVGALEKTASVEPAPRFSLDGEHKTYDSITHHWPLQNGATITRHTASFSEPLPRNIIKKSAPSISGEGRLTLSKNPPPQKSRPDAYTLIAHDDNPSRSILQSASVGDVIDGYGIVHKVIDYDDGSRMLMLDNGAVYVN